VINKNMSDDVNYVADWNNKSTQCKNCVSFQSKDGKNTCVPEDKNFEQALDEYGEVSPSGHCNYFRTK